MRRWTATRLAKVARQASRAAGKKGTDLPGQIARRVDKNILRKLASQVDEIVFISGTNGKTTTSNLIGHTLRANDIKIIHNNEGANMAVASLRHSFYKSNQQQRLLLLRLMKDRYQEC